jgi:hypothetical protein
MLSPDHATFLSFISFLFSFVFLLLESHCLFEWVSMNESITGLVFLYLFSGVGSFVFYFSSLCLVLSSLTDVILTLGIGLGYLSSTHYEMASFTGFYVKMNGRMFRGAFGST